MKKLFFVSSIISSVLVTSCNQNPEKTSQAKVHETENEQCYIAKYGEDIVDLKIHQHGDDVHGYIDFKFKEKQNTNGEIKGSFKNDTLYVDYNYKIGGNSYQNPLVFLKDGDKLLQGRGVIETSMGRTYFKPNSIIKFDEGFVFEPSDCK